MVKNSMEKLNSLLKNLETKIEFKDVLNPKISTSAVAWHLDHTLKVVNSVISTLKKSNPQEYKWGINFKKSYFLFIGTIPRGKAKAPKHVTAQQDISLKDIQRQLQTAKFLVDELKDLPKKSYIKHPFVGSLNLKQAIRFMEIHTNHHIKIMDDILNKKD
jgi:hypothetical protein